MSAVRSQTVAVFFAGGAAAALVGCEPPAHNGAGNPAPRPVTVVELSRQSPRAPLRMTGMVRSWKEEELAFEVSGRLVHTVEPGVVVEGPVPSSDGSETSRHGTLLARLDDERYVQKLDAAQARLEATQSQHKAAVADLEKILPAELKSAQNRLEQARKDYERVLAVAEKGAVTESQVDQAQTKLRTAQDRVDQIQGQIDARRSEVRGLEAQVTERRVAVDQAQTDLNSCILYAPFRGQVAEVHAIQGAFVEAGRPVVTLVMMDPLKVGIDVSAETDRHVHYGDQVTVSLPEDAESPGGEVTRWGTVFQKATTADPQTRTFEVTVLVRNQRIEVPQRPDVDLPRVHEFRVLRPLEAGRATPLFIEKQSLYRDEKGHFTWRFTDLKRTDLAGESEPVQKLERVDVQLGKRRMSLPGGFIFYELAETDGLSTDDLLACNVPEGFESGASVLVTRLRWRFRPGDLVEVDLQRPGPGTGLYAPMQAVIAESARHHVFVVDGDGIARRVPVELRGQAGNLWNIAPLEREDSELLKSGAQVVLAGAPYLQDGEAVRIIEVEEGRP